MFTKNTSLIIPTKNRIFLLKRTFKYLNKVNKKFGEILVIDSSDDNIKDKICNIAKKNRAKYFHTVSSSSYQRNFGLKKKKNLKFTMFLDDDLLIGSKSFEEMNKSINKNIKKYDAFAFNLISKEKKSLIEIIKNTNFLKKNSFYSNIPGEVLDNGWHTKILNLKDDTAVSWIYIGATIFKSDKVKNLSFDNSFGKYSYLEDLDFSLQLTKKKKLILVVSKATFLDPNYVNRNSINFGMLEIRNRYLIILKHGFNKKKFYVSSILRCMLSFFYGLSGRPSFILRSIGNIIGIFMCLIKNYR